MLFQVEQDFINEIAVVDADGLVGTDEIFDFLLTGHAFSSP